MTFVSPWMPLILTLFASPLIAYMYARTLRVGLLSAENFVRGRARRIELVDGKFVVAELRGGRGYIGFAVIGLDESFVEEARTPDAFFNRALVLGKILSNASTEVELRVARKGVDPLELASRVERELSSLRAVLSSQQDDEKLRERERALKRMYERLRNGERLGWLRFYVVVRTRGQDKKSVIDALRGEAQQLSRALTIALGARAKILERRALSPMLESLLLSAPRVKTSVGGVVESASSLALPPFERESLSPRGVLVGYRVGTRIPFLLDLSKYGSRHVLVVGPTGKGKTTFLATVANRLYARNLVDVTLIDPKGDTDKLLAKGYKRYRFSYSTRLEPKAAEVALAALERVLEGQRWRRLSLDSTKKLDRSLQTVESLERDLGIRLVYVDPPESGSVSIKDSLGERWSALLLENLTDEGRFAIIAAILSTYLDLMYSIGPSSTLRRLLIIDEAWRLSESTLYFTKRLVKESRGFGTGLILSTQSLIDLPNEILANFGTIVAFGSSDSVYAETLERLLGGRKGELASILQALGVGQIVIKLPDSSTLSLVEVDPEPPLRLDPRAAR
ncbi:MAG: DUF87 domain-containing protein [Fervidicoccaceae archaeon]